jgi:hypothetical protein
MFFIKKYDAFISYAIEDKNPVAEGIFSYLENKGIKICYVGRQLKVGDEISTIIYSGLKKSKYGIIILSPSYTRHWTVVEFYAFLEREQLEKKKLILPVWHNIDYKKVKKQYPILADRVALLTSDGLENTAQKIYEAIIQNKKRDRFNTIKRLATIVFAFTFCFVLLILLYQKYFPPAFCFPPMNFVETAIQKRVTDYEHKLKNNLQSEIAKSNARIFSYDSVLFLYNRFIQLSDAERNDYSFANDWLAISGRKNIRSIGIPFTTAPYGNYDITSPQIWLLKNNYRFAADTSWCSSFAFLDTLPTLFKIDTIFHSGQKVNVQVTFRQNIRVVYCFFTYSSDSHLKKQQIQIFGFKPEEEYIFEMQSGNWKLSEIK